MRAFQTRQAVCGDCKEPFKYKVPGRQPEVCKPCRYQRKLKQNVIWNRTYRTKVGLLALPAEAKQPLAPSEYPKFSRGWFKAQLAAGVPIEAMCYHTRRRREYIETELRFMGAA